MSVWLCISSYRNDEDVLRIIAQVRSASEKIFDRILIVDSEVTGKIPVALENQGWDEVVYRPYDENLGSGANLSERLRIAAEAGADYAYALNHDGVFNLDVVLLLLKAAQSIQNLGAAYPLSYFTGAGLYNITGIRELPLPAKLVVSQPRASLLDVFWSSSNGALYSMNPVRRGIVPWDALWMGWEDLEYGWRLHDHGYRQVIVSEAIFQDNYEYNSTKFGNLVEKPAWRTYYSIRNLILAIRRSRNRPMYYVVLAYRLMRECGLILFNKDNKLYRFRLLWIGVRDGMKGKGGKCQSLEHSAS